jgi:hypothetical protein
MDSALSEVHFAPETISRVQSRDIDTHFTSHQGTQGFSCFLCLHLSIMTARTALFWAVEALAQHKTPQLK